MQRQMMPPPLPAADLRAPAAPAAAAAAVAARPSRRHLYSFTSCNAMCHEGVMGGAGEGKGGGGGGGGG